MPHTSAPSGLGGAVGVFNPTKDSRPATKLRMGCPGITGVTGVTGVMAGVTAAVSATGVTAAWITAGVGDDDTAACGVIVASTAGAEPIVSWSDNADPIPGPGAPGWITGCTSSVTVTAGWCRTWVTALPTDGAERGDAVGPGAGVEPTLEDAAVEDSGVKPALRRLAEAVGDDGDVVEEVPVVVVVGRLPPLEDTVLGGGVGLCLGDSAPVDEPDEPDAVPDDEVPAVLVDGDGEPPIAVPSAWDMPDPLARAAPNPRVSAPAPSQE
jgi:hypothetical protein